MENTVQTKSVKDKIISYCIANKRPILIFIFTLLLTILNCIPHYDEYGNYKLFGQFRTKDEVIYLNKYKEINIQNIQYESKISSYESKENFYLEKIKSLNEKLGQVQENSDLLKSKFDQQEKYIKEQNVKKVQTKKKANKDKKTRFADVSKKIVNNDRPQFGNMFSNNIKKYVSDDN